MACVQHYEDRPGGSAFGQFENGAQHITRQVSSRIQKGTIIRKRLAKESWHGAADKVRVMFFFFVFLTVFSFPFDFVQIFIHFCTKLCSAKKQRFGFCSLCIVSMCVRCTLYKEFNLLTRLYVSHSTERAEILSTLFRC